MKATIKTSFYYLTLIPFLAVAIGFGLGHTSPAIYMPVWAIHTCMVVLLLRSLHNNTSHSNKYLLPAYLLVLPWVLFSIFAGFGPPPSTAHAWVQSATEQQIRYLILVAGGICAAVGCWLLKDLLAATPGVRYASIALALINISMPLFVINMLYWGFFLSSSFHSFESQGVTIRPDWYTAIRDFFYWVDSMQLTLFYLATAFFAMALKAAAVFKPLPCRIYIAFSFFGVICSMLPPHVPAPLDTVAYITAVPAIGFIMPYLMGLNLLRSKA